MNDQQWERFVEQARQDASRLEPTRPEAGAKKQTRPKRYTIAGAGFFTGLFAAYHLPMPPVGFYIAMLILSGPIEASVRAHPEDNMSGWWVVILGYPLNLLLYAIVGALLALKISTIVKRLIP